MAAAYGFDITSGGQGVIFALTTNAKRDRRQTFGPWEAELRKSVGYVCVRGTASNLNDPMSEMVDSAHEAAQEMLDIVAVEERAALLVVEPHNNVAWRSGPHGLKVELTSSITFAAEFTGLTVIVRDPQGGIVPDPPYVPPPHHAAYRYFRYSQAAHNVFDAYRNMFLALESMLDHVTPKQSGEGEMDWLKRALADAVRLKGLDLGPFAKTGAKDPAEGFLEAHYSAVRCAVFHSKSSAGQALRPGSLADQDTVLNQLLAVQALVEHLLKTEFSVRLPSGGFFHSGFGHLLAQIAPATYMLISVGECPTIEQVLADQEDLPDGTSVPVTFEGLSGAHTDEWLFASEIKPKDLSFTAVHSLRLVAPPNDHIFLGEIARKMNRTLMSTDLDLLDVSKLVVRVRCVLRNVQSPKHGFSH
jgi:hypothetical protein